jgi:hypothetical protein
VTLFLAEKNSPFFVKEPEAKFIFSNGKAVFPRKTRLSPGRESIQSGVEIFFFRNATLFEYILKQTLSQWDIMASTVSVSTTHPCRLAQRIARYNLLCTFSLLFFIWPSSLTQT